MEHTFVTSPQLLKMKLRYSTCKMLYTFGFDAESITSSCLLLDSEVKKSYQVNLNLFHTSTYLQIDPSFVTIWQADEANN